MQTQPQKRVLKVLDALRQQVLTDEDMAEALADALDDALDVLNGEDAFGTEGQNDPRGDFRQRAWSMRWVQGVDGVKPPEELEIVVQPEAAGLAREVMSTATPVGAKVLFAWPRNGYPSEQEHLQRLGLQVGAEYTVAKLEVSGFSTTLYLLEYPCKRFNIVNFANVRH